MTNDQPVDADRGLLVPGLCVRVGPIEDRPRHAHRAVQLMIATTAFVIVNDERRMITPRVAIPADAPHIVAFGAQQGVTVFMDPESDIGRAVQDHIGLSWSDEGLLDGVEPSTAVAPSVIAAITAAVRGRQTETSMSPRVLAALRLLPALIAHGPVPPCLVASRASVPVAELEPSFANQVGLSLDRYVLWLRLVTGVRNMANGDGAEAAARAAGFSDAEQLCHACESMFGMAPKTLSRVAATSLDTGVPSGLRPAG